MPSYLVKGVVQGVGFRPFVYRLARRHGLRGYVKNLGDSVEIYVHRESPGFLSALRKERPPLAEVASVESVGVEEKGYQDFQIVESSGQSSQGSSLPPDIALCPKCLEEIFDPSNRRHLYPFTVCTDCGPRYSIVESLPYDRGNTSMAEFQLCEQCHREYTSPESRRFKAEPTACGVCGPAYELYRGEERLEENRPIEKAARLLDEGRIVAIKGVGGVHLACSATSDTAVRILRERMGRREKPLAIMAKDIPTARGMARINEKEGKLLTSIRRPILLLEKRGGVSELVSPGLHNLGLMLPYTGAHYIMFSYLNTPALVMTSCNPPGEPMAIENERVLQMGYHDYALLHDRRIVNRIDDSVVRVVGGRGVFIRRSRGYVPSPIKLDEGGKTVVALGGEENVTPVLFLGDKAYPAQYVGNTRSPENLDFLESSLNRLMNLTGAGEVEAVISDLHPGFQTTGLAQELAVAMDAEFLQVQHHEAHIASVAAERCMEEGIGIALDGYGYGRRGEAWGGEVFHFSEEGYTRVGSLKDFPLIGGDAAVKRPLRLAAGLLSGRLGEEELRKTLLPLGMSEREFRVISGQLEKGINLPPTTSFGRALDAISALLGLCRERTYEGEPAMKLESFATQGRHKLEIPVEIEGEGSRRVFYADAVLQSCYHYLEEGERKRDIAASAQKALARGMAEMAARKALEEGLESVLLSGGVAYNQAIVKTIEEDLHVKGLKLHTNQKVAPGDNGLGLGQGHLGRRSLD